MIKVSLIIFMTMCVVLAFIEKEYAPNVGTVLFSHPHVYKTRWSKKDIGLLLARKYFQGLLPPLVHTNSWNDEYLSSLLHYFKNTYVTVQRESIDPESEAIMTAALSDTIGGYLKALVLPITKVGYYSGTISQDNALEAFQLYKNIKGYLHTDGAGWCSPKLNILHRIPIGVASPKHVSRSMKESCDYIAFFEKTPTGLNVPVPDINWDNNINTMFVPLKNVTLVPIESRQSSDALFHYYDAAKNCLQETNPDEANNFEERFQYWLGKDVLPHLKDDHLYLALGSVLSLVNSTQNLCDTVLHLYSFRDPDCSDPISYSYVPDTSFDPSCLLSTKLILIIVICICVCVFCKNNGLNDFFKELNNERKGKKVQSKETSERSQSDETGESEQQSTTSSTSNDRSYKPAGIKLSVEPTKSEFINEKDPKKSRLSTTATQSRIKFNQEMYEDKNTGSGPGLDRPEKGENTELGDQNIEPDIDESESLTDCTCDSCCANRFRSNKQIVVLQSNKYTEIDTPYCQVKREHKNQGLKLSTGKPFMEITLEKPNSQYCVMVDENKWKASKPRRTKPSKIPKRTLSIITSLLSTKRVLGPVSRHVSRVLQGRHGVDDIVVSNNIKSKINNKLNITI